MIRLWRPPSDLVPDCSCFDHDHVTITQHTDRQTLRHLITPEYCRAQRDWHSCCHVAPSGAKQGRTHSFNLLPRILYGILFCCWSRKKRHSVVNFIVCWSQFLKKFASMIQVLAFYFHFLGSENSRSFHQSWNYRIFSLQMISDNITGSGALKVD